MICDDFQILVYISSVSCIDLGLLNVFLLLAFRSLISFLLMLSPM